MSRINNTKLFLAILDGEKKTNHLKLFKSFLDMFWKDMTKTELLEENSKLTMTDFKELINEYYED